MRSFQLDRGRLKPIDATNRCDTAAVGLNDRDQIVIPPPAPPTAAPARPKVAARDIRSRRDLRRALANPPGDPAA